MRETTREFVKLTMVLVAIFLVVRYAKGTREVTGSLFGGWDRTIKAFQGR